MSASQAKHLGDSSEPYLHALDNTRQGKDNIWPGASEMARYHLAVADLSTCACAALAPQAICTTPKLEAFMGRCWP